jgi:ABC-type transport system involved in multi-copper enzyme maturation permease subunit
MKNRIATFARFGALEAVRTRLPLVAAVVVFTVFGASYFVREIAITESARFQTAFYAATIRYATVFLAALYVIASVSRELQDKGLEVVLALDVARAEYVLGRLAGFLCVAAAVAVLAGIPLVLLTTADAATQWTISLAVELAVVVALSVFCVITFNQVMSAASFVIAFYILARAMTAIRLISGNPIAGADSVSHEAMSWLVEAIAVVMPAFDRWTRTAWLVDEPGRWSDIGVIVGHGSVFIIVLATAAVFDLYRKNF